MTLQTPVPRSPPRIAVIIPFFQRQAGLLRRALESVAAQEYPAAQAIVVDDGSPCPADDEIDAALGARLADLKIVRQANQGVARARNAALDIVRDDIDAVALLDSDDYWTPVHLRRAAAAFAQGGEFYFSNSVSEGDKLVTAGEGGGFFGTRAQADLLRSAARVPGAPALQLWSAGISALFARGCPFATSAVAFSRSVKPGLRFPTNFRRAGEDQAAFWELVACAGAVMYCSESTVVSGRDGLGIWRKSTFGTAENLVRLADELRWFRWLERREQLSAEDRRHVRAGILARRRAGLTSAVHLLRRRHQVLGKIAYLMRSDPWCALFWPLELSRIAVRRLLRRGQDYA